MVNYRRNKLKGGTYFFTTTLRNRKSTLLTIHVNYTYYNLAKHKLIERVQDWPYSSFHQYVKKGLLHIDWAGSDKSSGGNFGE